MDPLSSLQFAISPELRAARMPRGGEAVGRAIPAAELEQVAGTVDAPGARAVAAAPTSFEKALGTLVSEVSSRQAAAGEAVAGMLSGGNVSLHQAMIAMEEASVSFQLMVEVRNKLLESYQELMRMQV